jgi:hypothetical protein
MVGVAGVTASEVGGAVLRDNGLSTDSDKVVDLEAVEVGLVIEDALSPRVLVAGFVVCSVKTVVENFVHDIVVLMSIINVLLLLRKGKMGRLRSAMSKSTRPKKNWN